MFHKEGHKIIFATLVFVVAAFLLTDNFIGLPWLQKSIQILLLVLFILILQFFRNPKRYTHRNDEHVLAPVDGKVVVIEEVEEPEFFLADHEGVDLQHPHDLHHLVEVDIAPTLLLLQNRSINSF